MTISLSVVGESKVLRQFTTYYSRNFKALKKCPEKTDAMTF